MLVDAAEAAVEEVEAVARVGFAEVLGEVFGLFEAVVDEADALVEAL